MNKLYGFLISFFMVTLLHGGEFLKQFVKPETQKFFVGFIEEKQKLLESLKAEQQEHLVSNKQLSEKLSRYIEEGKTLLASVESELKTFVDDEALLKQQSLLKESEQVLKDSRRVLDDSTSLLNELISQLSSFLDDPQFEGFKKKYKLQDRLYYSFEELQGLHENILDYEHRIAQLSEQEKSIRVEKESKKRSLALIQEEQGKKHLEIQTLTELPKDDGLFGSDSQKEKEILRLNEQLYKYKKQLEELSLRDARYKSLLIEFQLFINKSHLELFKKQLRIIKSAIHVSEADVLLAEEDLAKEQ